MSCFFASRGVGRLQSLPLNAPAYGRFPAIVSFLCPNIYVDAGTITGVRGSAQDTEMGEDLCKRFMHSERIHVRDVFCVDGFKSGRQLLMSLGRRFQVTRTGATLSLPRASSEIQGHRGVIDDDRSRLGWRQWCGEKVLQVLVLHSHDILKSRRRRRRLLMCR